MDTLDHLEDESRYSNFLSGATTRFSLDLLVLSWCYCWGVVTTALPTRLFWEPSRSRILVAELYTNPEPGYWAVRLVLSAYFPPGLGGIASGLKFDFLVYWF